MACRPERARALEQLAAGELDAEASGELLDHVEVCEICSQTFDLLAELAASARRPGSPLAAPPPVARASWGWAAAAALVLAAFGWRAFGVSSRPERDSLVELARVEALPVAESRLRALDPAGRGPGFDAALELYRAGDHAGAARGLEETAASRPDDALVHLYLGISRLLSGEPGPAREALSVAEREGAGLLRERALWYGAHASLELREGQAALEQLERLAQLDGDYRPNAEAKLRALRAVLGR